MGISVRIHKDILGIRRETNIAHEARGSRTLFWIGSHHDNILRHVFRDVLQNVGDDRPILFHKDHLVIGRHLGQNGNEFSQCSMDLLCEDKPPENPGLYIQRKLTHPPPNKSFCHCFCSLLYSEMICFHILNHK